MNNRFTNAMDNNTLKILAIPIGIFTKVCLTSHEGYR